MPKELGYRERYSIRPCPCGHKSCSDWHVWPAAALQGVKFTKNQAEAVVALLNVMEAAEMDAGMVHYVVRVRIWPEGIVGEPAIKVQP